MTTDKYKKTFKNKDSLEKAFDKESYTKVDFMEINLTDSNPIKMTIKANLYWFMEGYDGSTTVYFMVLKVKDKWFLDWIIY